MQWHRNSEEQIIAVLKEAEAGAKKIDPILHVGSDDGETCFRAMCSRIGNYCWFGNGILQYSISIIL